MLKKKKNNKKTLLDNLSLSFLTGKTIQWIANAITDSAKYIEPTINAYPNRLLLLIKNRFVLTLKKPLIYWNFHSQPLLEFTEKPFDAYFGAFHV